MRRAASARSLRTIGFLILLLAVSEADAQVIGPGANLRGADLSGMDLTGVDLSGAKLQRANLSEAILVDAILVGTKLNRADLSGADLQGADLTGAVARRASFRDADVSVVNASGAKLQRADFSGARLEGSNFSGAKMQRTDLTAVRAAGADFSGVKMQRATVRFASLFGAVFVDTNLKRIDLEGSDVRGADFFGADLKNAILDGVLFVNEDVPLLPNQVAFDQRVQIDLGLPAPGLAEVCATSPFSYGLYSGSLNVPPALVLGGLLPSADAFFGPIYSGRPIIIQDEAFVAPGSVVRSGFPDPVQAIQITSPNAQNIQPFLQQLASPEQIDANSILGVNVVHVRPEDYSGVTGRFLGDPNDPRNIFVMNPRRNPIEIAGTDRNDFFLDDVFTGAGDGEFRFGQGARDKEPSYDGNLGFGISLSTEGNDKVYFVDGNIWIHNSAPLTFRLITEGNEGTRITMVAEGNIFISDNFVYEDLEKDAIALIAIKAPEDFPGEFGVPPGNETTEGSGNILFGDPAFGTTFRFSGFMFAENNFLAENVDNELHVYGNMTAGNEVGIGSDPSSRNALVIDYDVRLPFTVSDPNNPLAIPLPGIPFAGTPKPPGQFFLPQTFEVLGFEFLDPNQAVELCQPTGF